jgi:signal transduction histidine kinase
LAQLFEAQKIDTIGQLTGGVAHDFNNLLMAVLGSLELLKKRIARDDSRSHRLLDNAVQGAERGAALTQRLLAFARRQELKPETVDVRSSSQEWRISSPEPSGRESGSAGSCRRTCRPSGWIRTSSNSRSSTSP